MRILVDLDAILVDSLPHWLRHIHAETGVKAYLGDIVHWEMTKNTPLDSLSAEQIYKHLQSASFVATAPIMPGAREAIAEFREAGHSVYFLTARSGPVSVPETYTWLKYHLPDLSPEKHLIFCYDKHLVKGDALIEDKAETLENYAKHHPSALLLGIRYPYNLHVKPGVATLYDYGPDAWSKIAARVKNWQKVAHP